MCMNNLLEICGNVKKVFKRFFDTRRYTFLQRTDRPFFRRMGLVLYTKLSHYSSSTDRKLLDRVTVPYPKINTWKYMLRSKFLGGNAWGACYHRGYLQRRYQYQVPYSQRPFLTPVKNSLLEKVIGGSNHIVIR